MLKKIVVYISLGIFISQIVGFTIFFNIEKTKIRKNLKSLIEKNLPRNELQIFSFSQQEISQLVFVKKNEFKLNGHFYDLVRKKNLSDNLLEFQCIRDDQETALFKSLSFLVDNKVGKEKHSPLKLVFSIIIDPDLYVSSPPLVCPEIKNVKLKNYFQFKFIPYGVELKVNTPPPRFLS